MNQDDHPAASVLLHRPDGVLPQRFYSPALDDRDDKEQHEQESGETAPRKDGFEEALHARHRTLLLHPSDN
jgi:hypothetical protein